VTLDRGAAKVRPRRGGGARAAADAVAVRNALEPLLVMDAARHRGEHDIRELRSALQDLAKAIPAGNSAFVEADWKLHLRIAEITPNVLARTLYQGILQFADDQAASVEHIGPSSDRLWLELRYQIHHELIESIASGETHRAYQAAALHRHKLGDMVKPWSVRNQRL
jgi:GntR family transcriptional repressor for pyruvate dehydrogenase complex